MAQPGIDPLPLTEILMPADQAAVADAVRQAAEQAMPLYPIGGGTSLDYGASPGEPGPGLSLTGLCRLVDYPARDLTITVEAGMTIADVARRLAAERQRLPIDVPWPQRATVGGVVASCPAGPRQYRWGSIRDYVIGIRAVDGLGTAFSGGGRVVKNAAGYDLCRLLTGSLGTLGAIVEVTLMVKPMPETSALVACGVPDWETAERLLAGLVQTRTLPAAIELLAGPAWQLDPDLGSLPQSCVGRLAVGLEGTLSEVEWMVPQLQEEWARAGVGASTVLQGPSADQLWERLTQFPNPGEIHEGDSPIFAAREGDSPIFAARKLGQSPDAPLVVRVQVLPGQTVATIESLLRLDPGSSILAHAGNGMILARLSLAIDRAVAGIDGQLRPEVAAQGGSVVVLSRPAGAALGRQTIWGPPRPDHALMQSIKNQFDPKDVLNRGRFIFVSPNR
jgi:glycolate oxidase FAD binding subunit